MANIRKKTVMSGMVFMTPYGGESYRHVGLCTMCEIAMKETELKLPDMENPGGGTAASLKRIESVEVSLTLNDFNKENLAIALFGSHAVKSAGNVVNEKHTATVDSYIHLAYVGATSITVTNTDAAPVPYDVGVDYIVTDGRIYIPSGSGITGDVFVNYTIPEQYRIDAMLGNAGDITIVIDQTNEADSNKKGRLNLHKVTFGPTDKLAALNEKDFGALVLKGTVNKDDMAHVVEQDGTEVTTTESKYFYMQMAA